MEYPHVSYEAAVGYMRWLLLYLESNSIEVNRILDIGAAHGHFANLALDVFPAADIHCIECNQLDKHYLEDKPWEVTYACLGSVAEERPFYRNKNEMVGGGSSLYKENTVEFNEIDENVCSVVPLDSLGLGAFDLIKIDTQGSEVDIIKGGQQTFKDARFVIAEMSFLKYNEGGCLIDDVIAEMRQLGYRLLATTGPLKGLHWYKYQPVQIDGLFAKEDEDVFEVL